MRSGYSEGAEIGVLPEVFVAAMEGLTGKNGVPFACNGGPTAFRVAAWVLVFGVVAGGVLVRSNAAYITDDAYIFLRYADNLANHGKIVWNPDSPPTFGVTSLLFLAVVYVTRLAIPTAPPLAAFLSSLIPGLVFLSLLAALIERYVIASAAAKTLAVLVILFSCLVSLNSLSVHFVSGMDTSFAMAYLTGYILAAKHSERSKSLANAASLGALGGVAFLVRPELTVYALIVPLAIILRADSPHSRRRGMLTLGVTVCCHAAVTAAAWGYFGSPAPLSFYVKTGTIYGESFQQAFAYSSWDKLLRFISAYWYLFVLVAADWSINHRRLSDRIPAVDQGLLSGMLILLVLQTCFVTQIQGGWERFYYYSLPPLLYLSAAAVAHLVPRVGWLVKQRYGPMWGVAALATLGVTLTMGLYLPLHGRLWDRLYKVNFFFSLGEEFEGEKYYRRRYWYQLPELSALPDDLVIATTEVGRVAAWNPQKKIVDLAGLNEPQIACGGPWLDWLMESQRPDLIYLPPSVYADMNRQILSDTRFRDSYKYYAPDQIRASMGLALRKDSKYFSQMQRIAETSESRENTEPPRQN